MSDNISGLQPLNTLHRFLNVCLFNKESLESTPFYVVEMGGAEFRNVVPSIYTAHPRHQMYSFSMALEVFPEAIYYNGVGPEGGKADLTVPCDKN